jgi:uncharacterized membrane protein
LPVAGGEALVQIDVPIAFGIGSLFADAASKQLRFGRPEYYYRAIWKNNIFQIFFFSWIPVYFLLNYFGWETTHMWWDADSVSAYPYYLPIFIVVFFACANAGFLLGKALVAGGKLVANRLVYMGIGVYALAWVFGQTSRTFHLGNHSDWQQGIRPYFYQDRTFLGMFIFTMVVWLVGLAAFSFSLLQEGKHLDYVETAKTA